MSFALGLGLLALSLVGAEGDPGAPPILYEVRILEMKGVDWRALVFPQLTPVARQGSAMIWTARREVGDVLAGKAEREVRTPKMTAASQAPAHVSLSNPRPATSARSLHRPRPAPAAGEAQRSPDGVMAVAYSPECEALRDKFLTTIAGRKLDQGVLTRLVAEDAQVVAVHSIAMQCKADEPPDCPECPVKHDLALDVPEVCRASIEGEWMIPNGGVLLVSFGAHTVADGVGKAEVRERLMLVEAKAVDASLLAAKLTAQAIRSEATTPKAADIPMPMPVPPSRHLPQALNAEGKPVALPPLPDEQVTPTSIPGTSTPCASPQARPTSDGSSLDPNAVKSSASSESRPADPATASPARAVVRPIRFRLPLNGNIEIEIRASAAQDR